MSLPPKTEPGARIASVARPIRSPFPALTPAVGLWTRRIWIGLGLVACVLGFIGIVLPGMPATVFFLAAAACFSRSSPRLLAWVHNLPTVGPLVRNYHAGLGMPVGAKVLATLMMVGAGFLSTRILARFWASALVITLLFIGAAVIWWWIPTCPRAKAIPRRRVS